jgi:hypothetical protein
MRSFFIESEKPVSEADLNELGVFYRAIPVEDRATLEQLCLVC